MATLLLALLLLASTFRPSEQHGWLQFPAARNVLVMQKGTNDEKNSIGWCPHCGQGRGGGAPGGYLTGICGDPYQGVSGGTRLDANANPPTGRYYGVGATLTQGQDLDVSVWLDTNHGGRMELSVCPYAKEAVTQACFDDLNNKLRRVNPGNANQDGKVYWYIPPGTSHQMFITAKFRLPAGISCANGCMLQWTWIATQTCSPPCEDPSIDVPGECGWNQVWSNYNVCGNYKVDPEWFRNCADVVILPSGGGGVVPTSSPPPPPPTVVTSPSPPPPTVVTSPSPPPPAVASSPPPPPPSSTGGSTTVTCNSWDWQCQRCVAAAQTSSIAAGYLNRCIQCASGQSYADACAACMTGSPFNGNIIAGCFDCIAQRPSLIWQCKDICSTWRCSPS